MDLKSVLDILAVIDIFCTLVVTPTYLIYGAMFLSNVTLLDANNHLPLQFKLIFVAFVLLLPSVIWLSIRCGIFYSRKHPYKFPSRLKFAIIIGGLIIPFLDYMIASFIHFAIKLFDIIWR